MSNRIEELVEIVRDYFDPDRHLREAEEALKELATRASSYNKLADASARLLKGYDDPEYAETAACAEAARDVEDIITNYPYLYEEIG